MRSKPKSRHQPPAANEAKTLKELANEVHRFFLWLEDAGTLDSSKAQGVRTFNLYYRQYLTLGGQPFQPTNNLLQDLIALEERCRGEMPSTIRRNLIAPAKGEWSQPMSKSRIKAALGIDSYYRLDKLAERGVYELKQDPNNRQRWTIRLDTLDPQARDRFQGI